MSEECHPKIKLVIHNLDQVVKVCQYGQRCLKGILQDGIAILHRHHSVGLSVVVNEEGKFHMIRVYIEFHIISYTKMYIPNLFSSI